MIRRIVKLTFIPGKEEDFLKIFNTAYPFISKFEGCTKLELLQEKTNGNIFFTVSDWQSETHLNNYRNSELFKKTWEPTKKLFQEKAEAWTTKIIA